MNIEELRNEIDQIDRQIVVLINERYRHVLEVGKLKKKQ